MNHYIPTLMIIVSLALMVLGLYLWRLTSSRGLMLNAAFCSMSLLYAAFEAMARNRPEWTFVLPFFATMLFGGRAAGVWWRSRKEKELQLPANLLWTATGLSLVATVSGYMAL